MSILQKLDRQVYKYNPDQMVVRLNDIIDTINSQQVAVIVNSVDGKSVIITGQQPDKTFGIVKWTKQGDSFVNPERLTF